jgi:hypothetical protein
LNRHFGAGSALTAIRNQISFHYSDKENLTERNFQQLAESEPLQFYLTKTVGNTFYHAAELIAQLGAINLMKAPPADPDDSASHEARAFAALCGEIIEVSRHITELFGELIGMLGESAVNEVVTEQLPDGPKLSSFSPFVSLVRWRLARRIYQQFTLHFPSTAAKDKAAKVALLKKHFSASWTEMEEVMPLEVLRTGYDALHLELESAPSRYHVTVVKPEINDSLPDSVMGAKADPLDTLDRRMPVSNGHQKDDWAEAARMG